MRAPLDPEAALIAYCRLVGIMRSNFIIIPIISNVTARTTTEKDVKVRFLEF